MLEDLRKPRGNIMYIYSNGITLAIRVFFLSDIEFFQTHSVPVPRQILIEELKASANAPGWEVQEVLDSHALAMNKTQLLIYTQNTLISYEHRYWLPLGPLAMARSVRVSSAPMFSSSSPAATPSFQFLP